MIFPSSFIIYIAFSVFLQLLVEVKSQATIFKPDLRDAHTATIIHEKLYIVGGAIPPADTLAPKETFLFLDCSTPFKTNMLEWKDMSATVNNIFLPHQHATAINGGPNNNTLFLYGGFVFSSNQTVNSVYMFDTQSKIWKIPDITGVSLTGRLGLTAVISYSGLIYFFGGSVVNPNTYYNDMFILDSINLSWKKSNSINPPSPRDNDVAEFLPDKTIIYM